MVDKRTSLQLEISNIEIPWQDVVERATVKYANSNILTIIIIIIINNNNN